MKCVPCACVVLTGLLATAARAGGPQDLLESYFLSSFGKSMPLRAGVTYRASLFPIGIRVTSPAPGWSGVQWKSGKVYFHGGGPPNDGWIHLFRGSDSSGLTLRGMVTITTAYAETPSVAATVKALRLRGRGAVYGAPSPVTLAGFSGIRFDGRVTGPKNADQIGHVFVPFSPSSDAAGYSPDEYPVYGDVFRVLVVDVRGKTVVVIIENVGLPARQFPAFLAGTDRVLKTLRFPKAKGA
jgi:hypothetical protein